MGLTETNLIAFLSANAQIFGALLGLIGLSYVRVSETVEKNVLEMLSALVHDFMEELTKDEKVRAQDIEMDLDTEGLGKLLDDYKHSIGETKHKRFRQRYAGMVEEMGLKRGLSRKFRINCWLSLALISLSMAGLVVPASRMMEAMEIFTLLLLALSIFALVQMVLFFLLVANTRSFLIFNKK